MQNPGFTIGEVWTRYGFGNMLEPYGLGRFEYEVPMLCLMAYMKHIKANWNDELNVDDFDAINPTNPEIGDGLYHLFENPSSALDAFAEKGFIEWVQPGVTFTVTEKFVTLCAKYRYREVQKPVYSKPAGWRKFLAGLVPKWFGGLATPKLLRHETEFERVRA